MNMENWLLIMLGNIVVICLLLYTKIYLVLQCKHDEVNDHIKVEVYIIKGWRLYSMQVPIIKLIREKTLLWAKSKIKIGKHQNQTQTKKEQRFMKKYINFYMIHPRKVKVILRQFRYYTRLYYQVVAKIIKTLHCEELYWKTSYGSEDAAVTGIIIGMLWTIKGGLLTHLKKQVVFETKPMIEVNPLFGQTHLKIDFQCIFSIRLGNVITAMRSMYRVKR